MDDPQTLVRERLTQNRWGMMGSQGHLLGLDIGSYGLRAALIDLHNHTYACVHREPTADHAEAMVDETLDLARGLLESHHISADRLVRIGIGFPGPVNAQRGVTLVSPRVSGWEQFPLCDRIEEAFGASTLLDNDANLIALAEATFGVGRDVQNLVYVHLSSGVGGGLVLNGKLYQGATTTAGEIGHAIVGPVDPLRPHGPPATLEQHLSVKALTDRAAELGLQTMRLEDIFSDHTVGQQVAAEAADLLAARLSQIIALLDPHMIVLGGVVARYGGDAFIAATQERMRAYTSELVGRHVSIVQSVLGFESVAIGGLALALESLGE